MESNVLKLEKQKFELIANEASSLALIQSAGAAFDAVKIVTSLRELLSDEIMDSVFMPLMNTKIGFLTDKPTKTDNSLYSKSVVRDCIIDAMAFGLTPTFNQFNIISGKMYATKEGYTHLLKKIGVRYFLTFGKDNSSAANISEIPVKIFYEHNGEKSDFTIIANVKKTGYSSYDQQKGKAEQRAKKALYELITGKDLGNAEDGNMPSDTVSDSKEDTDKLNNTLFEDGSK